MESRNPCAASLRILMSRLMFFNNDIKADALPPRTVCLTYDDGPARPQEAVPPLACGFIPIRRLPSGQAASRSARGRPSRSKSSSGRQEWSQRSRAVRWAGSDRTPSIGT